MPSINGLEYVGQALGSKLSGRLCMTSAPRRCGNFCRVHVWNSFRRVCKSDMSLDIFRYCFLAWSSALMKNLFANSGDPTGVPSRRNPSVSSTPMVPELLVSME